MARATSAARPLMLLLAVCWACLLAAAEIDGTPLGTPTFPSYFVIGQQKSGTSTLWALMNAHPSLKRGSHGGGGKEQKFFQRLHIHDYGIMFERCDRSVMQYMDLWRIQDKRPDELIGDFTPAHLSCYCCPELFHKVAPGAKMIAILRDPVSRSLSRFKEQYNWPFPMVGPLSKTVSRYRDFGHYAGDDIAKIKSCQAEADSLPPGGSSERLKWLIKFRCLAKSNCIGWSAYSIFLERWYEVFPKEQMLVLYTSDLEDDPEGTIRKVESHLGILPHTYDPDLLHSKFNTKEKYGWGAGVLVKKNSSQPESGDGQSTAAAEEVRVVNVRAGQGGFELNQHQKKSDKELEGDLSEMYEFVKPYMHELQSMVDKGLIPPMPEGMMRAYA